MKLEINLILNELKDDDKNIQLLREIFKRFSFSFFAYWEPNEKNQNDIEIELKNYFGTNNVVKCLNRIECLTVDLSIELLSIMEETDLNKLENWSDIENLIGCLVNDIET